MLNFKFSALAAIYAANVLDGGRTIEEVPAYLQDDVKNVLGSAKTLPAPIHLLRLWLRIDDWCFFDGIFVGKR